MLFGEAPAQLGMPEHVGPKLEEDGKPAVIVPLLKSGDQPREPLVGRFAAREGRFDLRHPAVDAAFVDGEEEVLLRREVGVHGPLRVAGRVGHGVHGRGVEAVRCEQALGGADELLTRLRLAIGACRSGAHTVSI